jgi:lysophospholipase L1-like esterase
MVPMTGIPSGRPRLIGRIDESDPAGPRFAWAGSAVAVRFTGTAIGVRLRGSSDYFAVTLDGAPWSVLAASPAEERYPLAADLAPGTHELLVVKRTEPLVGEAQLLGFDLDPGARLLPPPPPPARRIEFVGDSITVGFGVLGRDETCLFSPQTEDFTLSHAALTARALGADPIAVAWSGRGLCRNYADEPGEHLPVLYERTLPARAASRWDFGRLAPDAVVVNLGTNDFSVGKSPGRAFPDAYLALLRRIRAVYPGAFVFCAVGPMLDGPALREAREAITEVLTVLRGAGERRLELIEFPLQAAANGYGCDWHPSAATQRLMADQLTSAIRRALGW